MMRVAALCDIHGNLPALEAVLSAVRAEAVDALVVGGDVLPGPMPVKTLDLLRSLPIPTHFIPGNGENDVLDHLAGGDLARVPERHQPSVRWCADRLTAEQRDFLAGLPATVTLEIEPFGATLFCHATARSDNAIFTARTADEKVGRLFEGVEERLIVCGHTHMQFDRTVGALRIVNAGSIGLPFGRAGAHWLMLDGEVRLRRTDYDLEDAASRIRESGYPDAAFAADSIVQPPAEETIFAVFAQAEPA